MSEQQPPEHRTIIVPGERHDFEEGDALVSPADIGSASRSCLAILVVLLIIALLLCVFGMRLFRKRSGEMVDEL